ncbi:MAG: hypothetical protein ACREL1_06515 [bacterium]
MGHKIERQISVGHCQLTQCSCGQSALRVGKRVFHFSAQEVTEMAELLAAFRVGETAAAELNRLTGSDKWTDFKPEN